ncbi:hypothetical protein [Oceanisphaera profunda]|nr:hypothetical protein [Oceanisphaera profunda]
MQIKIGLLAVAVLALVGCFDNSGEPQVSQNEEAGLVNSAVIADFQGCSNDWYQQVDSQVVTGDGQGHGPDLGSNEWRSVVEFKLGIRGDSALADLNREEWCHYIYAHYIQDSD